MHGKRRTNSGMFAENKKKDLKIILALNCSLLDIECKNKTIRTFITFKLSCIR